LSNEVVTRFRKGDSKQRGRKKSSIKVQQRTNMIEVVRRSGGGGIWGRGTLQGERSRNKVGR